jgi:three-Cys-motif partner protein
MKSVRLEFNEMANPYCHKKCTQEKRKKITKDGLCIETVSVIDGLPVRCVGEWAMKKIFHLVQYFGIFSTGMKNSWNGNINYIEICSGTGRCINRSNGVEFNGTAICILEHEAYKYINHSVFIDYNQKVIDALNHRITEKKIINAKAIHGNYYEPSAICKEIKLATLGIGLNLVFIDPTDCSVPFNLLREIKLSLQHVDFIVNIAIGTDFTRNIRNAIMSPESHKTVREKYAHFLGSESFYDNPKVIESAINGNHVELRRLFREEYTKSLHSIGYEHFDFESIENYYDLIFASTHEKGIEFWRKANAIKLDGQRSIF